MTIADCPGCKHDRNYHSREAVCSQLVEMTTAGGETAMTVCGRCGWIPMIFDNGNRGWRHESSEYGKAEDTGAMDIEADTLEAALREVNRILTSR